MIDLNEIRVCNRCEEPKVLSKFPVANPKTGTRKKYCSSCKAKKYRENKKNKTDLPVTTKSKLKTEAKVDENTGIMTVCVTTQDAPADPKKFLISRGINPDEYTISGGTVSSWPTPMKLRSSDGSEAIAQVINFRVEAKIIPKKIDPVEFGLQIFNWVKPESKHKVSDRKADTLENVLVLPDMHFGYRLMDGVLVSTHDEKALELALKLVDIINPDLIVCLGDVMDLPEFSRHPHGYDVKGHTQRSLDAAVTFFNDLREITDAQCEVIEGNHDKRVFDWCKEEVKKLAEIPGIEIKIPNVGEMLGFEGKGITYHGKATKEGYDGYSRGTNVWKHRDWVYTHGEKCGKDAIAQTMQTYCSNIVMGHIHKQITTSRMIPVPTPNGMIYRRMWGVSPGMIGKNDTTLPGMGVERNYQQGVSVISHFTRDNWQTHDSTVTQIPFVDGQCFYGGQLLVA
jgi:predicted phosphodiesterase